MGTVGLYLARPVTLHSIGLSPAIKYEHTVTLTHEQRILINCRRSQEQPNDCFHYYDINLLSISTHLLWFRQAASK